MRPLFLAAMSWLLLAAAPAVRLPQGTPVKIALAHGISAKSARVDDRVYLRVIEAVTQDGVVIIPEDARVEGRVSDVSPPGGIGRGGSLSIEAEYALVGEDRVRLTGTASAESAGPRAGISMGVATIPLGKTRALNIEAGKAFIAYTARDY